MILEDGIINCKCSCPTGQAICHHAAALCIYAHHNLSSTDVTCSWSAPSTSRSQETTVHTIEDVYPVPERMNAFGGANRELTSEEINRIREKLENTNLVRFTWLLRTSAVVDAPPLAPVIEDILFSAEYVALDSAVKIEYLADKLAVSPEVIERVAATTTGQAFNKRWLTTRKNRLTASNFGIVLVA